MGKSNQKNDILLEKNKHNKKNNSTFDIIKN